MNQLKEAEKKASSMVAIHRKEQSDRMTAAKSEAESLVNDFKSDLESKHQAEVNSQQGASNTEAAKLTGESGKQIKGMQSNYNTKKDEVENMLAGLVTKVNNVPPKARQQAS